MVKEGYKLTEIGVIPEDWEYEKLDNYLELLTDFEANGSFESVAQNVSIFNNENYAWYVRATDLEKESSFTEVKFVDKSSYQFLSKTPLYGNEVLITKRGEIGKVYLFKKKTKYATLAPNMYLLKLKNTIDPYYLYSFFKSGIGNKLLLQKNASSTLGALYKDDVKAIKIPVPMLSEQKAIAKALSDTDKLITSLEALIEKKENIKTATMQQLLTGKKRLNGFNGEWMEKRLGDICDVRDGTHESPKYYDNGIKFITSKNIINGTINFSEVKFISKEDAYEIDKRSKVDKGDIIMSMIGTIGNAVLIDFEPDFSIKNVALFKPDLNKVNPIFLIQMFHSSFYQKYIENKLAGGIQKFISLSVLRTLAIPLPKLEEQQAIAKILLDMDKEIEALKTKLKKTKAIKRGMMQELLMGRIRLR